MTARPRKRGNGDGTIYPYKETRWRAALPMPDGSMRTRVHNTYAESESWLVEERLKRDQGMSAWSAGKMPTLDEWWTTWLDLKEGRAKRRTIQSYQDVRDRYIPDSLAKRKMSEITPLHIERLYAELARRPKYGAADGPRLSKATVHQVHRVLRACIKEAFRKGVISADPMARVTPPPSQRGKNDALSIEEVQAVLKAAEGEHLEALWHISLMLGPRQGESLAIKWTDIDWERRTLRIERQVHRVDGRWVFEPTKEEDVRTLPLDDRTLSTLRKRRAIQSQQRLTAGARWIDMGLVFTSGIGTPIEERNDRANWYALLDKAGVRRVRRHDARHTAGSLHYAHTRDPKHVQELLGHSDQSFTLNTYVHADAEYLRKGQESVAAAIYA